MADISSRANALCRQPNMEQAQPGPQAARMRLDLKLQPYTLEREFWSSREAMRGLHVWDGIACALAVVHCIAGLSKALGACRVCTDSAVLPWALIAAMSLHGASAAVGLLLMALRFSSYLRLRHRMVWANRLIRLVLQVLQRFYSVTSCAYAVALAGRAAGGPPVRALLINVMQPAVFWAQQAQFVVPFRWAALCQATSFVAAMLSWSVDLPCWLSFQAEADGSLPFQAHATFMCQLLNGAMSLLGSICGDLSHSALDSSELCQGATAVVILQVFASVLQMLVLPLVAIYWLELSIKRSFLAARNMQLVGAPWGTATAISSSSSNSNPSSSSSSSSSQSSRSSGSSSTSSSTDVASSTALGNVAGGAQHDRGLMLNCFWLVVCLFAMVYISWSVALMVVWGFRGRDCMQLLSAYPKPMHFPDPA